MTAVFPLKETDEPNSLYVVASEAVNCFTRPQLSEPPVLRSSTYAEPPIEAG